MPRIPVASADDPRLRPYRGLKGRDLAAAEGLFVAEGEILVRQLLASDFATHSVLLAESRMASLARLAVPEEVPLLVAPERLIDEIAGFRFHRGVLACGRRRPFPTLERILAEREGRVTLAVCPVIASAENLGSLVRTCEAFGTAALTLGPGGCDPFGRRVVRVSMGGVLRLPIVRADSVLPWLDVLRARHRFELAAAVLDREAEPLERASRPERLALLFGSEGEGLDEGIAARCDRRIRIPMAAGVDSLNVAAAAAVFLYHFTRVAGAGGAAPAIDGGAMSG